MMSIMPSSSALHKMMTKTQNHKITKNDQLMDQNIEGTKKWSISWSKHVTKSQNSAQNSAQNRAQNEEHSNIFWELVTQPNFYCAIPFSKGNLKHWTAGAKQSCAVADHCHHQLRDFGQECWERDRDGLRAHSGQTVADFGHQQPLVDFMLLGQGGWQCPGGLPEQEGQRAQQGRAAAERGHHPRQDARFVPSRFDPWIGHFLWFCDFVPRFVILCFGHHFV